MNPLAQDLLILASGSPRRQQLLADMGVRFQVHVADVEEWEAEDAVPDDLVKHNASLKAQSVARLFPQSMILGADTTVALDTTVLNKPVDRDDAIRMLTKLSGREHRVLTAVCLMRACDGYCEQWTETSWVHFKQLSPADITDYIEEVNVMDKAGAYAMQEQGDRIVARFRGSRSNIIGLPVESLQPRLRALGFIPA